MGTTCQEIRGDVGKTQHSLRLASLGSTVSKHAYEDRHESLGRGYAWRKQRGTRAGFITRNGYLRLIPAGAGNTEIFP